MVQDVVDVEAHRVDRLDAGDVARRKLDVLVLIERDDEALRIDAEIAEHLDDALRLRGIELKVVEDDEIAARHLVRECALDREAALLLRHAERIRARLRAEDRAAADPQRRARRAASCTTRALLSPRLSAAAPHEAARLRRMRAETARCELHDDGLMHEAGIHLHAEDAVIQFDIANLLVCAIINCYFWHKLAILLPDYFSAFFGLSGLTVARTTTRPFFGPGIAPLMRMRLRSASTRTTERRCTVTLA